MIRASSQGARRTTFTGVADVLLEEDTQTDARLYISVGFKTPQCIPSRAGTTGLGRSADNASNA